MTGVVIDRLIHMPRKYPDILTQVPNTSKPTCKSKVHVQRSGPLIADFENVVFSKYHSKLLSILYTRDLTLNKYTTWHTGSTPTGPSRRGYGRNHCIYFLLDTPLYPSRNRALHLNHRHVISDSSLSNYISVNLTACAILRIEGRVFAGFALGRHAVLGIWYLARCHHQPPWPPILVWPLECLWRGWQERVAPSMEWLRMRHHDTIHLQQNIHGRWLLPWKPAQDCRIQLPWKRAHVHSEVNITVIFW